MSMLLMAVAIAAAAAAGLYCGARVRDQPGLFWTLLIVGLVFTSPLMLGGYTWYDEIYAAGFMLPNLPRLKVSLRTSHLICIGLLGYLLLQALRGIAFFADYGTWEAITKVRWVFFVVIIAVVFYRGVSPKVENILDKELPFAVTKAGLLFNIIYLAYGLAAIYLTGSTSFTQAAMLSDQYRIGTSPLLAMFGATGYVVSVYLIFIPAALLVIRHSSSRRANVAWVMIALSITAQVLYNSRSGMLMLAGFLGLFVLQHSWRPRVLTGLSKFAPLVALGLLFQVYFNEIRLEIILQDLMNTLHLSNPASYNPALQDIDRRIWNASAVSALSANLYNMLFGWGLRTSGFIVAPFVYEGLLAARGSAIYREDVATPGFAALAVDSGVVGLLLIGLLVAACVFAIYRASRRVELFLLFAPVAFILQLFVMNIVDVLLLYLSIIPAGYFVVLGKWTGSRTLARVPARPRSMYSSGQPMPGVIPPSGLEVR